MGCVVIVAPFSHVVSCRIQRGSVAPPLSCERIQHITVFRLTSDFADPAGSPVRGRGVGRLGAGMCGGAMFGQVVAYPIQVFGCPSPILVSMPVFNIADQTWGVLLGASHVWCRRECRAQFQCWGSAVAFRRRSNFNTVWYTVASRNATFCRACISTLRPAPFGVGCKTIPCGGVTYLCRLHLTTSCHRRSCAS